MYSHCFVGKKFARVFISGVKFFPSKAGPVFSAGFFKDNAHKIFISTITMPFIIPVQCELLNMSLNKKLSKPS